MIDSVPVITVPDTYTPCHYGTAKVVIDNPNVNKTFLEVLKLSETEFQEWLEIVRIAILDMWDNSGVPPRAGLDDVQMESAWRAMESFDTKDAWYSDDYGVKCVGPISTGVGVVNQWFPTMMKTPIVKSTKDVAIGIYDMFAKPDVWRRYCRSYAHRHFQRDSFFSYTTAITPTTLIPTVGECANTAEEFVLLLNANRSKVTTTFDGETHEEYGILFAPQTTSEYTGFNPDSGQERKSAFLLTAELVNEMKQSGKFPEFWFRAVRPYKKVTHYALRLVNPSDRIFPLGFKSFRISMTQFAANFPPLIAKSLYERYAKSSDPSKPPLVWDPSSGWAGRITGAILAGVDYIGTDPNRDHLWQDASGGWHSKYTEIVAYFRARRGLDDTPSKALFFPCGSEVMKDQPKFQEYKGKVDMVFTSPPYFLKEFYSGDPAQSCNKYTTFDSWCEGFLRVTLETAAEWLRPGGVLLWNIADAAFEGGLLPIEAKSIEYATKSGLVQEPTIRMILTNMPGQNRVKNGIGTMKNSTKVGGKISKFEPIFVFRKA